MWKLSFFLAVKLLLSDRQRSGVKSFAKYTAGMLLVVVWIFYGKIHSKQLAQVTQSLGCLYFTQRKQTFGGHHALTASALLRYPSFAFTWSWKTLPFCVQLATDNVHGNQIRKSSSKWQITRKKMWWKWILYLRIEVISDDEDNGPCMPQPVVDLA